MRKFFILSWILGIILLISCSDDKNEQAEQTPFNQPNKEVKVYTEAEMDYVSEYATENTLVFGSNTPDNVLPQVGSIIQMPISEKTPYGFLGKVISIDKGENIRVETEMVSLEEAFPNLSLDVDLTEMKNVELLDEDGNPVEFYIEDAEGDSISTSRKQTRGWGIEDNKDEDKYTKISEFDWKKKKVKIPIPDSWVEIFTKEKIDLSGVFELSFEGSDIKMDNKDGDSKFIDIDIRPRVTVGLNIKGHIKQLNVPGAKKGKKEWKTPNLIFRGVIPAGPVTFPITIPICWKSQLEGDFSTSVELRYNKYFRFHRTYKNGKWSTADQETPDVEKNSPWGIAEFDASGKFCTGPDLEVNIGIYTSLAGIGMEFYLNGYIKADASISTLNPFEANAEVEVGVGMEWRAYCRAELFGKKVEPFSMKLPEVTFMKRTLSLFPSVDEFDAVGGSSSAEVNWITDSYYLLEPLGVKTGTTIYNRDYTEYSSFFPDANNVDRKSHKHYSVNVTGLQAGTVYYAAPTMSWLGWKWVADKDQWKEIETEAKYHLGFRCSNYDYDVISFEFDLNNKTGNVIDYTTEASDYDGSPMRVHITATYNSSNQTLNGIFDFFFYRDPSQQRKDGFTVSLATDDSGYVDCSKVIDNGGCYAALRIYKTSSSAAARKMYAAPLVDDDCNVGIFNKNYTR